MSFACSTSVQMFQTLHTCLTSFQHHCLANHHYETFWKAILLKRNTILFNAKLPKPWTHFQKNNWIPLPCIICTKMQTHANIDYPLRRIRFMFLNQTEEPPAKNGDRISQLLTLQTLLGILNYILSVHSEGLLRSGQYSWNHFGLFRNTLSWNIWLHIIHDRIDTIACNLELTQISNFSYN